MSESIDTISMNTSASKFSINNHDKLSEETKKKLEALGIDPSTVKTETEAQQKIKEAESAQANAQVQGVQINSPMAEIVQDAKDLAEKIGLSTSNIGDFEKFLEKIDKRIKEFEKEVENDKDDERRKMVDGVRGFYEDIKAEYEKFIMERDKITNDLDIIATYNMIRS